MTLLLKAEVKKLCLVIGEFFSHPSPEAGQSEWAEASLRLVRMFPNCFYQQQPAGSEASRTQCGCFSFYSSKAANSGAMKLPGILTESIQQVAWWFEPILNILKPVSIHRNIIHHNTAENTFFSHCCCPPVCASQSKCHHNEQRWNKTRIQAGNLKPSQASVSRLLEAKLVSRHSFCRFTLMMPLISNVHKQPNKYIKTTL